MAGFRYKFVFTKEERESIDEKKKGSRCQVSVLGVTFREIFHSWFP